MVKYFKSYSVLFFAVMLLLGISSISQAADKIIGFSSGVNFIKPSDKRFTGQGSNFSLVLPIDQGTEVVIYHETSRLNGKEVAAVCNVNLDIEELRIQKEIAGPVSVVLGSGWANLSGGIADGASIVDVGVKITPMSTLGKYSTVELSIDVMYRFLKIANAAVLVTDPVGKLDGFAAGINVSLLF
ncbi:MAG: hypothetical protein PHX78_10165 [bacterium]|nr:hypothetical protein [bacterium]